MDVVKKSIEELKGFIEIESEIGKSTKVVIKLPLTLAIIDGLLVKVSDNYFVLPISITEECIEHSSYEISHSKGNNYVNVRGELTPYIDLREEFGISGGIPDIEQIVISNVNGKRVGFVVDTVIGKQQTVIKSIGKFLKKLMVYQELQF